MSNAFIFTHEFSRGSIIIQFYKFYLSFFICSYVTIHGPFYMMWSVLKGTERPADGQNVLSYFNKFTFSKYSNYLWTPWRSKYGCEIYWDIQVTKNWSKYFFIYQIRKNYCNAITCNKCQSYLVRHGHDEKGKPTKHQLWFLCSALAYHDDCCSFNIGPSLFTYWYAF